MDEEETWLDEYYEEMKSLCEEKKRRTNGKCQTFECMCIGWCADCLAIAEEGLQR